MQAGSMVKPLAFNTVAVRLTVAPGPMPNARLMLTAPGGYAIKSAHCALAPTMEASVKHSTSSPCATRRGVVEMFMVKKLVDEEKGETQGVFEKECKGLFINVNRFGIDRCCLQFKFRVFR